MKINFVMGIDPGKNGGWALLSRDLKVERYGCMPLVGGEVWVREIADILIEYHTQEILVVLEKVASMPGQGVKSVFSFGESYGKLKGMCQTLGIRYEMVIPQTWKRITLQSTKKDKNAAIEFVQRRFPEINLTPGREKKASDGISDAVCMAVWGVRTQI